MTLRHGQAVWLMVAVTLMWSIAGVVTRQLVHAQSFEVTFWRSFFTVLSLLIILPAWQGRGVFGRIQWRRPALWLSGLCWSVMFTAFMLALTLTTVANVLVTLAAGPLLTALVARIFIGHRMPLRTWVAIVLAGFGIAWMYGRQLFSAGEHAELLLGSLVAFCVPIAASVNWTVVQRSNAQGEKIDLVPAVLLGAVISSLVTLPLAFPLAATPGDVGWLARSGEVEEKDEHMREILCPHCKQAQPASPVEERGQVRTHRAVVGARGVTSCLARSDIRHSLGLDRRQRGAWPRSFGRWLAGDWRFGDQ